MPALGGQCFESANDMTRGTRVVSTRANHGKGKVDGWRVEGGAAERPRNKTALARQ